MIVRLAAAGMLAAALLAAGCSASPITPAPREPTRTPAPSLTPTRTPVWFPATETPTLAPMPSARPTEDLRPALGEVFLRDSFSTGWQTFDRSDSGAAYGTAALTLTLRSGGKTAASLRSGPLPGDFYLEVTAEASLCQGGDTYGVYLRSASLENGYRLVVNCRGEMRAERLKNAELVVLQDWTPTGVIPPGGLLPVRLGVWAAGADLRFFANGAYQFSVRDPVWSEGQVGVYVRAAGDTPVSVTFSDLQARALDPLRLPTATPFPTPTP